MSCSHINLAIIYFFKRFFVSTFIFRYNQFSVYVCIDISLLISELEMFWFRIKYNIHMYIEYTFENMNNIVYLIRAIVAH